MKITNKLLSIVTVVIGLNIVPAISESYTGTVQSLIVYGNFDPNAGKRGNVQVQIKNAPQLFILSKDDPYKAQMLSVLLTAQSTGSTVTIETLSPTSWSTIYSVYNPVP